VNGCSNLIELPYQLTAATRTGAAFGHGARTRSTSYDGGSSNSVSTTESLGVLEVEGGGAGFVSRAEGGYLPRDADVYVPPKLVQRFGLRTGDEISGEVGSPPGRGKGPPLTNLTAVNGRPPEEAKGRPDFNRLTAIHPKERLVLETEILRRGQPDYTNRIIDLFCPFGKGQRALIVAPSKAGKTTVLQCVAEGVVRNNSAAYVYILLVDERPEEVTEMEACGFGEVIASSFDNPPQQHISVAEMTLERAKRRVELGEDVVVILDSITRLARAYNTVEAGTGRTMTGGLDANALEKPKRFLGSARRVDPRQGGGSLTILATALVDTGSRMDDVIYEEFKGTGNMEVHLDRRIAEKRIFPAIHINRSGTRREELLMPEGELQKVWILRKLLHSMDELAAMEFLMDKMKDTKTNAEFFDSMRR
jgi:transcription termination factor Rho